MICIGFDPGLTGAVAFLYPNGVAMVDDLPTKPLDGSGMITRTVDPVALYALLAGRLPKGSRALAVLEHVHTFPGSRNSPQTGGSLMHSRGTIEAVLSLAQLVTVAPLGPQVWKRTYNLRGAKDGGKRAALDIARKLYPNLAETRLARIGDHNRAEALLIARHLQRVQLGISIEGDEHGT